MLRVCAVLAVALVGCADHRELLVERSPLPLDQADGAAWVRDSGIVRVAQTPVFPQTLSLHFAIVDDATAMEPARYPIRSANYFEFGSGPLTFETGAQCPNTNLDGPAYGCAAQLRVDDFGVGMLVLRVQAAYGGPRYDE